MAMTPLTGMPDRSQAQSTFDANASSFFSAKLPLFVTEANALQADVDAKKTLAETAATTATTQAGTATTQAGIATAQATLAGNWATLLGTPVSGGEYSAKHHAIDAAASAASAINSPGTQATSVSSIAIGMGLKSFTLAETGKHFVVGQWVLVASTASPSANWMMGAITAFVSGTGACTVDVVSTGGSGTLTSWSISQASPNQQFAYQGRIGRTSNTILSSAEIGKFIDITAGTFTQTFDAAATLGGKWYCYIRNSGSGDITLDPNGSEQIDGLTSYVMYPGETRLVTCDGTGFYTIVLTGYYRTYSLTGSWTKPPGYKAHSIHLWGGGGGGGKASSVAGGGGGGAHLSKILLSTSLPSSLTVAIGGGGAGATTLNSSGGVGGASSFNTCYAYGGGAGGYGGGGGGGGVQSSGGNGTSSGVLGGKPTLDLSATTEHNTGYGGGAGAGSTFGDTGGDSAYGGGGGGNNNSPGGNSTFGGGGGGAGNGAGGTSILGGAGGNGNTGIGNASAGAIKGGGGGGCSNASTGNGGGGGGGYAEVMGVL